MKLLLPIRNASTAGSSQAAKGLFGPKFYVGESSHDRPDWLRVDLTLGTSVFSSTYLTKQRNKGVLEYKRNGLE
ncbi:unnamed protein product [Nyctereutes procyonoides]|uniref:NADH dehydrogenase [ubiquinone] 1 subunit C1, mitochondrial n=1 Tax=Nyctereutes procyonoides TaxID=34880 RepID=A0A811YWL0_NYCPR|nr:unnamed protein product [Nyctereutes procyonoides]